MRNITTVRSRKISERELVGVIVCAVVRKLNIENNNASALITNITHRGVTDNEELLLTVRAFEVKGKTCLVSIDGKQEFRRKLRGKETLRELVDDIIRRVADERGIRLK